MPRRLEKRKTGMLRRLEEKREKQKFYED